MRYMWNIGSVTSDIPSNVIPEDFPQFQHIMDDWGNCMLDAVSLISELLALGLGLER
jgi:isopenicillin N synthase-like dioxygenase